MKRFLLFAIPAILFIVACNNQTDDPTPTDPIEKEKKFVLEDWEYFEQGWSSAERDSFWFTSQGSRILPYDWFTALEEADGEKTHFTPRRMWEYGYLPAEPSAHNPGGLPIGFSLDRDKVTGEAFVGLTCAACHTNVIEHDGKSFLIDGAPSLADFVGFFDDVVITLRSTHDNEDKFDRFAHKVLGNKYSPSAKDTLFQSFSAALEETSLRQQTSALPDHYPSDFTSFGRLDAFTNIENAGSVFALDMKGNGNPAIAPVSYPFLWGTHQSDVVQWNGSASNLPRNIGPLVRNTGEVVGVFGGLKIRKRTTAPKKGELPFSYTSTADFAGLEALEAFVKTLEAPSWDDPAGNLPAVDPDLVTRGAVHYKKLCAGCHQVVNRDQQMEYYTARMVPVKKLGTDSITAMAAMTNMASTGILKGMKVEIIDGPKMGEIMPAITIPVNGVAGLLVPLVRKMIMEQKGALTSEEAIDMVGHSRGGSHAQEKKQAAADAKPPSPSYKARPLNGIWATAPYLHNGSVPNLWELLKKPEDRVKEFWVGSHEIDTENVGFVTTKGKNKFRVMHQGQIMAGNSNLGHPYGTTQLSEEDKRALIEYMKTL